MCGCTGLQMLRHKRSAVYSCWRNLPVERHVDSSVRCEIFMEAMLAITPLWWRTTNYLYTYGLHALSKSLRYSYHYPLYSPQRCHVH